MRLYLRAQWSQHGKRCAYCERPITLKEATADHGLARSKGGATRRSNIIPACLHCNRTKGVMHAISFRAKVLSPSLRDPLDIHIAHFRLVLSRRLAVMDHKLSEFCRR